MVYFVTLWGANYTVIIDWSLLYIYLDVAMVSLE